MKVAGSEKEGQAEPQNVTVYKWEIKEIPQRRLKSVYIYVSKKKESLTVWNGVE